MGDYDVCVKGMETYTIRGAKSKRAAIIRAMEHFVDDDMYYGTEEAESVTESDCEIIWFEEY